MLKKIRVKELLHNKDWTQRDLADATGWTEKYISEIINGKKGQSYQNYQTIADHLDTSVAYLTGESDNPDPVNKPVILLKRMRQRREDLRLSQEALGKKIGVTGKTVWRLENGEREIKSSVLLQIAGALDTSVAYLMGETDDPMPRPVEPMQQASLPNEVKPTPRILDPEKKPPEDHEGLMKWLRERGYKVSDEVIYLPVLSPELTACCGRGISILECTSQPEKTMPFSRQSLGRIDDYNPPYVVHSEGNSMKGYGISNGALCAVNPVEEVSNGDIAFVQFGDDAMIKKVYWRRDGAELRSSDGEIITISKEDFDCGWARILGRVMAAALQF